jgi:hypothetical protein
MSIEIPEKCPKCGAKRQPCLNAFVVQFECGSMVDAGDGEWHDETGQCLARQRDLLARRVAELEEALRKVQFYGATGCLQDSLDEAKRIAEEALKPKGQS